MGIRIPEFRCRRTQKLKKTLNSSDTKLWMKYTDDKTHTLTGAFKWNFITWDSKGHIWVNELRMEENESIVGNWRRYDQDCHDHDVLIIGTVQDNGSIFITGKVFNGLCAWGRFDDKKLTVKDANDKNQTATLSTDGKTLTWDNNEVWVRAPPSVID